ncbi:hypothetical protein [Xanthomonas floridensis]|uniref:Uncharacterized protein n=1 Tax=Xanthomonas floridensis TaxID=1843580 RepID=A0A1A9MH52_9XANT|nr:hypothetical protein [Xanthomonas floridensis]MEA5123513.1 hypothetical protein [Xanthomonas floridensis]MEA5130379.1 hypothetical protein [Xanthomonas floridensis]OAG69381.1 hypothetical protein A7D17_00745 [Xanthomonas floridensis]
MVVQDDCANCTSTTTRSTRTHEAYDRHAALATDLVVLETSTELTDAKENGAIFAIDCAVGGGCSARRLRASANVI